VVHIRNWAPADKWCTMGILIPETYIKIDWKISCLLPTCSPSHLNPLQFGGNRNKHPCLVFCTTIFSSHLCTCSQKFPSNRSCSRLCHAVYNCREQCTLLPRTSSHECSYCKLFSHLPCIVPIVHLLGIGCSYLHTRTSHSKQMLAIKPISYWKIIKKMLS
jgi:hypothetical protein